MADFNKYIKYMTREPKSVEGLNNTSYFYEKCITAVAKIYSLGVKSIRKSVCGMGIIMYNELTPNDIKKMEEEIEYRIHVVRKEALEEVKTARAHGDLSENFEYHAAKREKNRNESRIRYLQKMIKTATIISDESAEDEAGVNNTVEIFYEDDESTEKIKLVTTVRGDSLEGLISIESPLGKALLGHKVGDRVLVEVNDSVKYYVVIKAIENSDDSDDKIQPY